MAALCFHGLPYKMAAPLSWRGAILDGDGRPHHVMLDKDGGFWGYKFNSTNHVKFRQRAEPSQIFPSFIEQNRTTQPSAESKELIRTKARAAEPYNRR
ncbi:unnamed protein product [Coccothraustes coccothraustes]